MRKNLTLLTLTMMIGVLMGRSSAITIEGVNVESLKLDTKWMGTYEEVDAFPYTTLEVIRYEDGTGKYIRTIYQNGFNEVLEGQFIKVEDTKVQDEVNNVGIEFSDYSLTFKMEDKNLAYKKISPIVQEDFKLSNGLRKDMSYVELKKVFELTETPEGPDGPMNATSIEVEGIFVSLHSNTESVEDADVFGYRVKNGDTKTFRGIGIGSSVDDIFTLYGPRELYDYTTSIEYTVGQYSLIFIIADKKVCEIHCMNTI
ncbi:hypothetical protein [Vallitalea maricola]|uniref:Uncharacterized protein n=1 Tax=Vallitalea maricola TaxID=3074433 RepID=A0ACB5UMQ0_9FIRM|nr:hypothetical protein AN2V17_30750 [Vallitalea sp. AN17-2]